MVAAAVKYVGPALNGLGMSVDAEQLPHLCISSAEIDMAEYATRQETDPHTYVLYAVRRRAGRYRGMLVGAFPAFSWLGFHRGVAPRVL